MVYRFIINKRNYELLLRIERMKKNSLLMLSRESNISYPHLSIMVTQFYKEGLVNKTPTGMGPGDSLNISLSEKGKEVLSHLSAIDEIMKKEVLNE